MTPYLIGVALAVVTFVVLKVSKLDRDNGVYPVILIVIAAYYILFAAISGSWRVAMAESVGVLIFTAIALAGFRFSPWLVAAGIAAHGAYDSVHASLITDPGVPVWWPAFCGSIDIALGALLAFQLWRSSANKLES